MTEWTQQLARMGHAEKQQQVIYQDENDCGAAQEVEVRGTLLRKRTAALEATGLAEVGTILPGTEGESQGTIPTHHARILPN